MSRRELYDMKILKQPQNDRAKILADIATTASPDERQELFKYATEHLSEIVLVGFYGHRADKLALIAQTFPDKQDKLIEFVIQNLNIVLFTQVPPLYRSRSLATIARALPSQIPALLELLRQNFNDIVLDLGSRDGREFDSPVDRLATLVDAFSNHTSFIFSLSLIHLEKIIFEYIPGDEVGRAFPNPGKSVDYRVAKLAKVFPDNQFELMQFITQHVDAIIQKRGGYAASCIATIAKSLPSQQAGFVELITQRFADIVLITLHSDCGKSRIELFVLLAESLPHQQQAMLGLFIRHAKDIFSVLRDDQKIKALATIAKALPDQQRELMQFATPDLNKILPSGYGGNRIKNLITIAEAFQFYQHAVINFLTIYFRDIVLVLPEFEIVEKVAPLFMVLSNEQPALLGLLKHCFGQLILGAHRDMSASKLATLAKALPDKQLELVKLYELHFDAIIMHRGIHEMRRHSNMLLVAESLPKYKSLLGEHFASAPEARRKFISNKITEAEIRKVVRLLAQGTRTPEDYNHPESPTKYNGCLFRLLPNEVLMKIACFTTNGDEVTSKKVAAGNLCKPLIKAL